MTTNAFILDDPLMLDESIDHQTLLDMCVRYDSVRCYDWLNRTHGNLLDATHFEQAVKNIENLLHRHHRVKYEMKELTDRPFRGKVMSLVIKDPRAKNVDAETYGLLLFDCVAWTFPEAVKAIVDGLSPERCDFFDRYNTLLDYTAMSRRMSYYPCHGDMVSINLYLLEVAIIREKVPLDYQSFNLFLESLTSFDHGKGLREIIFRCDHNPIPTSFYNPFLLTAETAKEQTVEKLEILKDEWRWRRKSVERDAAFEKLLELVEQRLSEIK